MTSAGGHRVHSVRFGLLPQVLPVFASQILYYFESNTRSATIIGIVGAGGIGMHLYEQIKVLEWQSVSFLVLLVLAAVTVIDQVSSPAALRHHRAARRTALTSRSFPPIDGAPRLAADRHAAVTHPA